MPPLASRNRFFDDFFRDFPLGYSVKPLHGDPLPTPDKIRIEVKENASDIVVHAEMPGVSKEDIHVSVDGNLVTIQAEVKQHDAKREDEKTLHSERYYGAVQRSFTLPSAVDQGKVSAKYENGVLVLTLPKETPNAARRIAIE